MLFFKATGLAEVEQFTGTSGSSFQGSRLVSLSKDPIVASKGAYAFEMPLFRKEE